jgi:hypothetical protein
MGPAVLNGGFSTFLSIVLLCNSNSHVFLTFFKVMGPSKQGQPFALSFKEGRTLSALFLLYFCFVFCRHLAVSTSTTKMA